MSDVTPTVDDTSTVQSLFGKAQKIPIVTAIEKTHSAHSNFDKYLKGFLIFIISTSKKTALALYVFKDLRRICECLYALFYPVTVSLFTLLSILYHILGFVSIQNVNFEENISKDKFYIEN